MLFFLVIFCLNLGPPKFYSNIAVQLVSCNFFVRNIQLFRTTWVLFGQFLLFFIAEICIH